LDYFLHASNILLLASYSLRDILWLRALAVASSLVAMPFHLQTDELRVARSLQANGAEAEPV
jgi:hypothetical protein